MPKLTIDEVQRRISASFEENVILVGSYQNKRTNISLKCQDCGYEWETKAQNVLYLENATKHHCPNCWKNQMQNGKFLKCSRCGKEICLKATRCGSCYGKINRSCERPEREELKSLIREKTFVEIGRIYGVSDNAVRKWCKIEKLPSKKKEIKNYSNEEWLLI